ncbi:M16 family metallopeptidase [Streptomyces althioticus]|uniref:M16 family metallopeptidase n=1 Tax=Streptomyces althioticus TaxID=83380 RepID=UPI00369BE279
MHFYPFSDDRGAVDIPVHVIVHEHLRTAALCLGVAYGSRDDPATAGGLAHMLEHVLMSSPRRGTFGVAEQVEWLGGEANAQTGLETMLFTAHVQEQYLNEVLGSLTQAVLRPRWDKAYVEQERGAVQQELAAMQADPSETVQDAFLARLFGAHPLGRPVGGTLPEVSSMSMEQIASVHETVFLPAPMVLCVVAPRPPEGLSAGERSLRPRPDNAHLPEPLAPRERTGVVWPEEFAWVCVGGRAVPAGHPGAAAFQVLSTLLGDSPSSLLYQRLRRDGSLAYMFQSWYRGYAEAGAWRTMIGLEPENGPAAVDVVLGALEELAGAGPKPEQLGAAVRKTTTSLLQESEGPLDLAKLTSSRVIAARGPWSLSGETAALNEVTVDDVRRAAALVLEAPQIEVRPAVAE